jgi:hypothetical protein
MDEDTMKLRDYFAGQALAGLLAHTDEEGGEQWSEEPPNTFAAWAYGYAEAMMEARRKQRLERLEAQLKECRLCDGTGRNPRHKTDTCPCQLDLED